MEIHLTAPEKDFLCRLLKEEANNLLDDLDGERQISETAIRLLNEAHDFVSRLKRKIEET